MDNSKCYVMVPRDIRNGQVPDVGKTTYNSFCGILFFKFPLVDHINRPAHFDLNNPNL